VKNCEDYQNRRRNERFKRRYGITLDDYNEMLKKQSNKCKICKISPDNLKRKLCIDHCHETGKIRGLLCDKCNNGD